MWFEVDKIDVYPKIESGAKLVVVTFPNSIVCRETVKNVNSISVSRLQECVTDENSKFFEYRDN